MFNQNLEKLYALANEAHARIQQEITNLDPIIGVSQKMRQSGVPADLMTIDCLKSGKRIIIILSDQEPNNINYQFAYKNKDFDNYFEQMAVNELSATLLYKWMKEYFTNSKQQAT